MSLTFDFHTTSLIIQMGLRKIGCNSSKLIIIINTNRTTLENDCQFAIPIPHKTTTNLIWVVSHIPIVLMIIPDTVIAIESEEQDFQIL